MFGQLGKITDNKYSDSTFKRIEIDEQLLRIYNMNRKTIDKEERCIKKVIHLFCIVDKS